MASHNALTLLKDDHELVKDLFERFEDSEDASEKKQLAEQAIAELKIHAEMEEELFYPALRKAGADGVIEEADEEHHVAKLLIAELEMMSGDEENWDAKFTVLAESVRHHIKEEESEVFKKAKKSDMDLDALGRAMYERKQELKSAGVPKGYEEKVFEESGLQEESPSKHYAREFRFPTA
jgi:hypothetical protein